MIFIEATFRELVGKKIMLHSNIGHRIVAVAVIVLVVVVGVVAVFPQKPLINDLA